MEASTNILKFITLGLVSVLAVDIYGFYIGNVFHC